MIRLLKMLPQETIAAPLLRCIQTVNTEHPPFRGARVFLVAQRDFVGILTKSHLYESGLKSSWADYMMQWSNLTKCGLFFNIVFPAVHTFIPSVLQRLNSSGIESLILILEKVLNCRYYLIIDSILLSSQVFVLCLC